MTNPLSRSFRTIAVLVLLVAGFGLGNLIHEAIPHSLDEEHGQNPQTCAVCMAAQHSWGEVASSFHLGVVTELVEAAPPAAMATRPASPEAGSASPRSPPRSA